MEVVESQRTADKLKQRRLDRMRMGQDVCEIFEIPSDPEMRVAMVPLTEAEYDQCQESAVKLLVEDTIAGNQYRDRRNTQEILVRSLRETEDLSQRIFDTVAELTETLEVSDINFLIDHYLEMVDRSSPMLDGLTDEELEQLKKALMEMSLSDLSGKQWYALKRFLLSLGPGQLRVKLPGSSSIKSLTGKKDSQESTPENALKN